MNSELYRLKEDEIAKHDWTDTNYTVILVPIKRLLPTEEHCDTSASTLAKDIHQAGIWTTPILIEEKLLFVMDGHHRLAAGRLLALDFLPCIPLTYDDPRVELTAWSNQRTVSIDDVVCAARSGVLLPRKTTRHILFPKADNIAIRLSRLKI